jgi:flavorubredoxin
MFREVTEGLYWLQEDYVARVGDDTPDWHDVDKDLHSPVNAYLLVADQTLLFDTLTPARTAETLEAIEEILNGRSLDYVVPSHGEAPHAGNTNALTEAYPETTVLAAAEGDLHEVYFLEGATRVHANTRLDLGGMEVEFIKAPFIDTGMHTWLFEHSTRTLFSVDWVAFPHDETECLTFADEMDRPDEEIAQMLWLSNGHIFPWFEHVDTGFTEAIIDNIQSRVNPEIIAPAHGQVIRKNAGHYVDLMREVMAEHASGRMPRLV